MPGFTSVAYRQSLNPSVTMTTTQPVAAEAEQSGGGLTAGAKGLSKAQRIATGLTSNIKATRAGYRRLGDVLEESESLLPSTSKVAGKTSSRGLSSLTDVVDDTAPLLPKTPKPKVRPKSKARPKARSKKGQKAASATSDGVLAKTGKAALEVSRKLKNKNLGEIVNKAPNRSQAVKGVAKELGKRGGKAGAAAAATAAFTAGAAAGINLLEHVAKGGEPMSKSELKKIAIDTGLRLAKKGLEGKLTKAMAVAEISRGFNDMIKNKQGGKFLPKNINLVSVLGNLGKLLARLRKIHRRRHYQVNGEEPLALETRRRFGTGEMEGELRFGGGKRRGGRKPRKHKCKRRRKSTKRKRCSRHGSRKLHNIFSVY